MKYSALHLLCLASPIQSADWSLDAIVGNLIVRGTAKTASGVSAQSLVLDGTSLIELKESAQLTSDVFTVRGGGADSPRDRDWSNLLHEEEVQLRSVVFTDAR